MIEHAQARIPWLGELVGSAGLLFVAVTAVRLTAPDGLVGTLSGLPDGKTFLIGCAIAGEVALFGLTSLGRQSGGQLNPAVTFMLWLRGNVASRVMLAYIPAQLAGSFVGVAVGRFLWGAAVAGPTVRYSLIQPQPGLSAAATAGGEFGMTCVLLLVVALAVPRLTARPAALAVFTAIFPMIWLGGGWSGASFNPIRNFAPAVFSGDFHLQIAYLGAPMVAAAAVAAVLALAGRSRLRPVTPNRRSTQWQSQP